MAAVKFSKQRIQPNPLETSYWVDLSENMFGGIIKYYNGDDWVPLNNSNNGNATTLPLTIKNSIGEVQLLFDGSKPKELILTKELIGLNNVDNTKDVDKNVKHAEYSEYSYELKRIQDEQPYVTYGFIGSDPYTIVGNANNETWVQGNLIQLKGNTTVSGSLTVNGEISLNELIIKNYNEENILSFDGNAEKTLTLTKDIVGLNNVDNTADTDKTVKHASTSDVSYALIDDKGNNIASTTKTSSQTFTWLGNSRNAVWLQGDQLQFWTTGASGGYSEERMRIYNNGEIIMDNSLRVGVPTGGITMPRTTLDVYGEIWTTEGIQINGTKISKQESGALEIDNDLVVTNDTLKISIAALYAKVIELEQEIAKLKQ